MNDDKVKFINYNTVTLNSELELSVSSTCSIDSKVESLPDTTPIQITQSRAMPKLLINIYNPDDPKTDYNKIITSPKLSNALFIYLSNNTNSGYAGGTGGGTAAIGNRENTFGIITGQWDTTSNIPKIYKANGKQEYGFQNLNETNTFKLCHHADGKTYSMTPKQAIDYLLGQLYKLITEKKYEYVVLPCDLEHTVTGDSFRKYTLGAGLFNSHLEVKRYIYENICSMTRAAYNGWQLITDFL